MSSAQMSTAAHAIETIAATVFFESLTFANPFYLKTAKKKII